MRSAHSRPLADARARASPGVRTIGGNWQRAFDRLFGGFANAAYPPNLQLVDAELAEMGVADPQAPDRKYANCYGIHGERPKRRRAY